MGRPKGSKNKKTLEKMRYPYLPATNIFTEPAAPKEDVIRKKVNKYKKCELCNGLIYSSPYTANLATITGSAGYKRDIPDLVRMCSTCSNEFSNLIEKWMIKKGLPVKYGYKRDDSEYES